MLRQSLHEQFVNEDLTLEDKETTDQMIDHITGLSSTSDDGFNVIYWNAALAKAEDDNDKSLAGKLYDLLSGDEKETLKQLHKSGPVDEGDVTSKHLDQLISLSAAARVVNEGKDGHVACTQKGHVLYAADNASDKDDDE